MDGTSATEVAQAVAGLIMAVIAVANIVTAATPTQTLMTGRVGFLVDVALRVLNVLALNIAKNTNADDPASGSKWPGD